VEQSGVRQVAAGKHGHSQRSDDSLMQMSKARMNLKSALILSCLSTSLLLAACAPSPTKPVQAPARTAGLSSSAGVGGTGAASVVKASSEIHLPDYVAVRRYDDVFREEGRDVPVTVEYGWDYRRSSAIERIYERGGSRLRSERAMPGLTLNVTDAELELAFALTRENPELRTLLIQPDLNFYGGFSFEEADDPVCRTGSRCIHVIISAGDGERSVAHAIVDLATRQVVHPFYVPPPEAGKKP
jgi:hypothetical protein